MKDILSELGTLFFPKSALILFQNGYEREPHVESYDIDENGYLRNAHPLSVQEGAKLAATLKPVKGHGAFLSSEGLLPENLLYLKSGPEGEAIWFTPARKVNLYFKPNLGIPSGMYAVPPLIWKASKNKLALFAVKTNKPRKASTRLYYAPFFNTGSRGDVCMGDVKVKFSNTCTIQEFISSWETYFCDSYFNHLITNDEPVNNMVELWRELHTTQAPFPLDRLKPYPFTLQSII